MAALPAHRALVRGLGARAPPRRDGARSGDLGRIEIPLGERKLTLRTRADRIETLAGGGYAILDYKTGTVPTEKQVRVGISPQLTLEAAILRKVRICRIRPTGANAIAELVYVSLKGTMIPGEAKPIEFKTGNPPTCMPNAR